jgi:hypothetical protein
MFAREEMQQTNDKKSMTEDIEYEYICIHKVCVYGPVNAAKPDGCGVVQRDRVTSAPTASTEQKRCHRIPFNHSKLCVPKRALFVRCEARRGGNFLISFSVSMQKRAWRS